MRKDVKETVEHANIAVFDSYIISTIGYSGKVMVVAYDDSPQYTETFTWRKGGNLAQEVKIRS